jgi:hypothetical protein
MSDQTSESCTGRKTYSIESGRRIAMLDVRPTGGGAIALPYSCLQMVQFTPPTRLTLAFTHCEIRIEGDRLLPLYTSLIQHAVVFIQESDANCIEAHSPHPFIKSIEIKPPTEKSTMILTSKSDYERSSKLRFRFHPA